MNNSGYYGVDDNNQVSFDGAYEYHYDNEGNLIRRTDVASGNYVEYAWDHRNRLLGAVEHELGEGDVRGVEYTYDAHNQLIARSEWYYDGSTEKSVLVYQDGQIVLQFHRENLGSYGIGDLEVTDLTNRFLWGQAVDQLLADENVEDLFNSANNDVPWPLTDHLGSIRHAVDSSGELRLHRRFDGFGNIVAESYYDAEGDPLEPGWFGYAALAFAYTGRPYDETTVLQNNLHRWYALKVGRWMSEDPIGFAGGDANLYRYVVNQPINLKDPSGLFAEWAWGVAKGAAKGAYVGAVNVGQKLWAPIR
ncbi:MAG TPA: RHS repeat-associated core domain-containing protein [Lacipirellulaceae bacterium]|nr:RHS repeat-associated core domain-containing protein [Lacipirellulaceae bacterium]